MFKLLTSFALAVCVTSTAAIAQTGPELAKDKGCIYCHAVDGKKVGPALKEIASKHRGERDAETKLVEVLKDGKGHPRIAASDAELRVLVKYVLSQ